MYKSVPFTNNATLSLVHIGEFCVLCYVKPTQRVYTSQFFYVAHEFDIPKIVDFLLQFNCRSFKLQIWEKGDLIVLKRDLIVSIKKSRSNSTVLILWLNSPKRWRAWVLFLGAI